MPTYGVTGSTYIDELNRLANGGASYPARINYLDAASAARAWAASRGVTLNSTDTTGVINQIAGLTRGSWKDLAGVCNYIAGTTGLDPVSALRQVAN